MTATTGRNAILDDVRADDLAHDPWGTGIGALFAVADALTIWGISVPADLDYRPSPMLTRDDPSWRNIGYYLADYPGIGHTIARMLIDGDIDGVLYAARVLNRFDNVCRMAGRNY